MQMNPYNLREILFCLQRFGVQRFYAEFTDHGGELGVFLFFQKPIDCSSTESSSLGVDRENFRKLAARSSS